MNEKNIRLVTAESVRAGHPDKFCDQVADAILDAHLRQYPNARVAVEVFATAGKIVVGGEITSKATVTCDKIVAGVINRIGYTMSDLCGDPHGLLELEVCLHEQSPDISAAVGKNELGAGDQGIVVGYATSETEESLPLPVVLAHRICKRLDELKPENPWMGADGKAQVTVAYENDVPVAVTAVVVSLQHNAEIDHKGIRCFIGKEVLQVKYDRKLLIAIGRSRKASQWQNKEMLWSEFLDKLATTTRTRETVAEYAALPKGERDTIKDVGGFVGEYLKNGRRNNASVVNRCMLCLDADNADPGLMDDLVTAHPRMA